MAEAKEAKVEFWNASPRMPHDGCHVLVDRITDGDWAADDRARADTEIHVEAVDAALIEAVVEALHHAELEEDARDAAASCTQSALSEATVGESFLGFVEELSAPSRVGASPAVEVEMARITSSFSWRITAPIRWIKGLFKR